MTSRSQPWDYDIIIAGAGIVGATVANALAGSGLRIGIIERNRSTLTWPDDSTDLRVSAITEASQRIFENLGIWPQIQEQGVSPYRAMYVWDSEGTGCIRFDSDTSNAAQLGHIIENRIMQAALIARIERDNVFDFYLDKSITQLYQYQDRVEICLSDNSRLTAGLLVGADGGQSLIRQLSGIDVTGWSYQQQAIVTIVETELSHEETAWQCFLPNGPLAFLPLQNGRCSIVWSTTPEQARELLTCNDSDFCAQLGSAFNQRLGEIRQCTQRLSFPLRRQHAEHYISERIALIGDAAHTIHPLAGQGVNLGLLDAAALAEVILENPANFFTQRCLRHYERWRRGDNLITMSAMDGFKHIFGSTSRPVTWLRNSGLRITDQLPILKDQLMYQAMGRKGDLPRIAKTESL